MCMHMSHATCDMWHVHVRMPCTRGTAPHASHARAHTRVQCTRAHAGDKVHMIHMHHMHHSMIHMHHSMIHMHHIMIHMHHMQATSPTARPVRTRMPSCTRWGPTVAWATPASRRALASAGHASRGITARSAPTRGGAVSSRPYATRPMTTTSDTPRRWPTCCSRRTLS